MSKSSIHRRAAIVRHPGSYAVAGGAGIIGTVFGAVMMAFMYFIVGCAIVAWWVVKALFQVLIWGIGKAAPAAADRSRKFYLDHLVRKGELTPGDVKDLDAIRAARPVTHWVPGDRERNLQKYL